MITLQNNRFVKDAKVSATGSISRGFGVFETLRTFHNKKLPLLNLHLARLEKSAKQIGLKMPYKTAELKKMLEKVVAKSKYKFQRIKIIATDSDLIITSVKGKEKSIATLKSVQIQRALPEIKSISYLPSLLANQKAEESGYSDALLINQKEEVFECAYANIFWFEGTALCTRQDQILPGITRDIILKISPFKIKFKKIKLNELKSKEVFISQSISLITPVLKIDKIKLKSSEKTQKIIEEFNAYLFALQ